MAYSLLFGALLALTVLVFFLALRRVLDVHDPVDARLKQYGVTGEIAEATTGGAEVRPRTWPVITRLINGFGFGPALAADLVRADVPLTAAELALIGVAAGLAGFILGGWRGGFAIGLAVGIGCALLPIFYVRSRGQRRAQQFTDQLPEVLTFLVGALRAGYGLPQAIALLVEQLPPPASIEFGRAMRAIGLGMPVQRAVNQMADRLRSDDLDLVVTAINVQYELGGNLVQTLETIGDTVRDRIRMKREIRSLTAQQRMTGYVLAAMPIFLAVVFSIISPGYLQPLFQPGRMRLLLIGAVMMQIAGFLIIRKIVDIEV
jgi:tight adherence protein B